MTNKLRRSMTSVLLAASLLFSSQSVVAFADYGSKSDASDLSPVQESVENATEEQQEDPSLSVEPVIGESTEAPVAAPMMARANAPVAYSVPSVDTDRYIYSEDFSFGALMYDVGIYITQSNNQPIGTISLSDSSLGFGIGTGYRTYTISSNSPEWVFDNWDTYVYLPQWGSYEEISDTNSSRYLGKWTFSMTDNVKTKYDGNSSGIRLNYLLLSDSMNVGNKIHYTLKANFNPLVTVNYNDEQGSVTADKPHGNNKFEAEYAQDKVFTITTSSAYKPYVNNTECTLTNSDVENDIYTYTYTLLSVTEPTTLEVTFDKTEEQPVWKFNAGENGSVKWNDGESKDSIAFTKSNVLDLKHDNVPDYIYAVPKNGYGFAGWSGTGSDNFKGTSQVSLDNPSEDIIINATAKFNPLVTVKFDAGDHGALDPDKSTRQFASDFNDLHGLLTSPSESDLTIDEGWRFTGWTLTDRGLYSEDAFIEFYEPLPPINEPTTIVFEAQYEKAPAEQIEHIEINLGDNLRKEIPFTPIYLHAEYDGDYIFLTGANKHFTTPPVSSIPDTLKADVDDPTKAQEFFSGFTCLGLNVAFDKHYISNTYISEARVEGTTLYMTLDIPAPEAPANINELLDVTLNCENPDHPEEYGKSKTYSDLLPNSYTIGEVKNNNGTYTCDITVYPETYLTDYSQNVTKTNHILVTTPENPTGIATVTLKYEDGAWKTAESPVTFTVTCKQSIPLTPSKPSDDDVKAIMDKISVTVDCTNTTGHDPMNHTLTGAEFTVGDIYSVAPFADQDPDPVILCPVTINNYVSLQNGFITQYNAATNESHTLSSGFIPASIVLTYNKDAQDGKGAWENHDLENITLSLTCNPTTPGGGGEGTNPGGNGGDNDDDDDRYTGGNTVTRTINDDDVPLNDRPTNTTTIDDEDVPLADLPDDTVTIDDGEVPLKANPSTGDSLPFAAMAAAALSLGGVIVLNRKKK